MSLPFAADVYWRMLFGDHPQACPVAIMVWVWGREGLCPHAKQSYGKPVETFKPIRRKRRPG